MTHRLSHSAGTVAWVAFVLLGPAASPAGAQQSGAVVESVSLGGQPQQAVEVELMPPSKKDAPPPQAQKVQLAKGQIVPIGTEVRTPGRTQVVLRSGENTLAIEPSTRLLIQQTGTKGDVFSLLVGKALFTIGKVTNVFNVTHKDTVAHVGGTKYAMEVVPGQTIRYAVLEGKVRVEQQKNVQISEAGQGIAGVRVSQLIAQGATKEFRIGADEYLQTFKTYRDAEAYFRSQLEQALASKDAERIDEARYNLGTILTGVGQPKAALPVLEAGLKRASEMDDEERMVDFLQALGQAHSALSEYDKAAERHVAAIEVLENGIDPELEGELAADASMALGGVLYDQGRFAAALQWYEYAAGIVLDHVGDEPDAQLAQLYIRIGATERRLGHKNESWQAYDDAIKMLQALAKAKALDPLVTADALLQLGVMRGERDDHAGALRDASSALGKLTTLYPDRPHPLVARALRQIGVEHSYLGDTPKGLGFARRALDMFNALYPGGTHVELSTTYSALGRLTSAAGDPAQAARYHLQSLEIMRRRFPDGLHPDIARAYWHLSLIYRDAGNAAQAADYKQRYQTLRQKLKERDEADAAGTETDEE